MWVCCVCVLAAAPHIQRRSRARRRRLRSATRRRAYPPSHQWLICALCRCRSAPNRRRERAVRPVAVLALPGAPGVVCFCTGSTSQVHLGFSKCTLRACRCAHGHTGAPLKPRGTLCINKAALCINKGAHLQGSIYVYSPHIYLVKKAGVR
jgi:hypothetical protein